MLKPIAKPNVPQEIIRQIMAEIRSGVWNPGDRLPTERKLGEMFSVGRSSIREALKVLETIGIIKRTTEGTTLCGPGDAGDSTIWLVGCQAEIHEVFEARKLMEIELAGLAAQRATPDDLRKMNDAIAAGDEAEAIQASDVAFHRGIVEAAKNRVFSQVYDMVTGLLFQTHKYYSITAVNPDKATKRKILAQHREIVALIESQDSMRVREAMRNHLDFAEELLIHKVQEGLSVLG